MKNIILLFSLILLFSIIFVFNSCDVLTKMNEQEWNDKNLDEEEKKDFFIYAAGYSRDANADSLTVKYDSHGNQIWIHRYDNAGNEETLNSICIDKFKNIYATGVTFGATSNFLTIKYAQSGNVIYNEIYDPDIGVFDDTSYGITIDNKNEVVYVIGQANARIIISRYNLSNIPISGYWTEYTSGMPCVSYGIVTDSSDNIYFIGSINTGAASWYTIKLDPSANILWEKRNPNSQDTRQDEPNDIAVDRFDNIYIVGYVDANTVGPINYNLNVIKYDSNGNILLDIMLDFDVYDFFAGIAVDYVGNFYITGRYGISGGPYDIATIKYDYYGNKLWEKHFDTGGSDSATDIALDEIGNVYVCGSTDYYTGTPDFLLLKYDYYGNLIWEKHYNYSGGISNDQARSIVVLEENK